MENRNRRERLLIIKGQARDEQTSDSDNSKGEIRETEQPGKNTWEGGLGSLEWRDLMPYTSHKCLQTPRTTEKVS